ncbi:TlyA family RNA methyltransferase [Phycicoccus flavus]|uniref:TlyA family RNA methyltransferase n=1 Tax=Phycicoccus flavus TaxID=2502783 RepID=A0A8T6R1N0_9MICO|nr:TlyA family RNA methyltransferase [Phycicoccus flavus]NHA67786.1 TlyA family RNA methyltransferase [Phycicoccus flavus]
MPRLDAELVRRGLARSRGDARDLVAAGRVSVDGRPARKPAHPVDPVSDIVLSGDGARWVGRGALKLRAALDRWTPLGLDVRGRSAVDVGASTGGFTEVLLDAGAAHVVALDVGRGQLVPALAADPRVSDRSGTTVRGVDPASLGGPFDVVVTDLSFISLTLVAAELAALLAPGGDLVALVKPQFEVGRARLGSRGVVTDAGDRADALRSVLAAFADRGLRARALAPSPVTGSTGNAEYLLWARSEASDTMTGDEVEAAVEAVVHDTDGGGP